MNTAMGASGVLTVRPHTHSRLQYISECAVQVSVLITRTESSSLRASSHAQADLLIRACSRFHEGKEQLSFPFFFQLY